MPPDRRISPYSLHLIRDALIALVYDGVEMHLYVNGVAVGPAEVVGGTPDDQS